MDPFDVAIGIAIVLATPSPFTGTLAEPAVREAWTIHIARDEAPGPREAEIVLRPVHVPGEVIALRDDATGTLKDPDDSDGPTVAVIGRKFFDSPVATNMVRLGDEYLFATGDGTLHKVSIR